MRQSQVLLDRNGAHSDCDGRDELRVQAVIRNPNGKTKEGAQGREDAEVVLLGGRGIPGDLCCQLQACVYHHQDGLFHRSPSGVHGIPIQFHKFGSILDKYKKPVVEPWQPSLGEQGHYSDRIGWKFIVTDLGRRNTN